MIVKMAQIMRIMGDGDHGSGVARARAEVLQGYLENLVNLKATSFQEDQP